MFFDQKSPVQQKVEVLGEDKETQRHHDLYYRLNQPVDTVDISATLNTVDTFATVNTVYNVDTAYTVLDVFTAYIHCFIV